MKLMKYLVMIALIIAFASCGKDGSMGPAGDKGDAGAQGGAGMDGKTILNGTSDPKNEEGKSGDFYINTNSYVLFGPKTASGWGTGKSILGAKGDKGDKGATGATGDKGATGATGDKGATGATGDKGDTGAQGAADYVILSGSTDPTNSQGKLGDFYYNTINKTLFYRAGVGRISTWKQIAKLSNTIQFTKTIELLPGFVTLVDFDFPWDVFGESMVNAYISSSPSLWDALPNRNSEIYYMSYPGGSKSTLAISWKAGGAVLDNAELRIVVTQAEVFKAISKKINFKDYNDVSRYFNLGN